LKQAVIPVFNLLETSLVVSYINDYDSVLFPANYDLVQSQRVKRIELPYYDAKHNPDYYAKPLDIIKIFMIYFDEERRE
jgi:hypothetical protein